MSFINKKFIFFGTPDVASETLEYWYQQGYAPSLIVTAPDRPVGRHFTMTAPEVKKWAEKYAIPILQPEKIDESFLRILNDWIIKNNIVLFVVVAYGKILPTSLIDMPLLGTINIHYSLLPRFRGASPVESTLLHGDTETGITIQQMVYELDAGPIIASARSPVLPDDTTHALRTRLITQGASLVVEKVFSHITEETKGRLSSIPQQGEITICKKIKKQDGHVDLNTESAQTLWNKYRAYFGWPGIFYFDESGKRVKITQASYNENKFIIERVIPEGKNEIAFHKIINR